MNLLLHLAVALQSYVTDCCCPAPGQLSWHQSLTTIDPSPVVLAVEDVVKYGVESAKKKAFTVVPHFSSLLADAGVKFHPGDVKYKSLNTRFLDEAKLRHMIPRFSIEHFGPAFVAVRALDAEAKTWLDDITTHGKDSSVLCALLSVLQSKNSLRPVSVLEQPLFAEAMEVLRLQRPVGPVNTIKDLIDKRLMTSAGSLPHNLRFDPVTGQHSFVFGRMFQLGVSPRPLPAFFVAHTSYAASLAVA